MKRRNFLTTSLAAATIGGLVGANVARAQSFPAKPI
jgi:hypothetical protein